MVDCSNTYTFDDHHTFLLQEIPTARLTLTKPKKDKKVNWREGTVDNEDMNKKKSKCK